MASLKPVPPLQINTDGLGDLITGTTPRSAAAVAPPAPKEGKGRPKGARKRAQTPAAPAAAPAERTSGGYVGGRLRQVGIRVDDELADHLEQLAAETRLPLSGLMAATLYAGLPDTASAIADSVMEDELLAKPERRYFGPRLPSDLKEHLDELTAQVKSRLRAAKLADVINATLRAGLPQNAGAALSIHESYQRAVLAEQWQVGEPAATDSDAEDTSGQEQPAAGAGD